MYFKSRFTLPTFITLITTATAADLEIDLNTHLNLSFGQSSTNESSLAAHNHDPNDEFTLQGLELNLSARYGDHIAGFIGINSFLDQNNNPDAELEEAFIKFLELPAGLELRAGRYLNRVSTQNSQHLHSWNFVDADLITSRFLGDEGLATQGLELSYRLPFEHDSLLSISYGNAPAHDEEGNEEHAHSHDEVTGEGAFLTDHILSSRLKGIYYYTDFKSLSYGASYLTGTNGYQKRSHVISSDITYLWRENGIEPGGRHLRAIIEPIYRSFDYANEDGDTSGNTSDWGLHSELGWGFQPNWEIGLRHDILEGVNAPVEDLSGRQRASLALTRSFALADSLAGHVRLQYNHDWIDGSGQEDSIWLQFKLDFGSGYEVR